MKRRRISYSRKRKYEMGFYPTKKQLIYNLEVIDRENAKYHVFLYF
jgi:hypothetical protein